MNPNEKLLGAAENAYAAFVNFGTVDNGTSEGKMFEEALRNLKKILDEAKQHQELRKNLQEDELLVERFIETEDEDWSPENKVLTAIGKDLKKLDMDTYNNLYLIHFKVYKQKQ